MQTRSIVFEIGKEDRLIQKILTSKQGQVPDHKNHENLTPGVVGILIPI